VLSAFSVNRSEQLLSSLAMEARFFLGFLLLLSLLSLSFSIYEDQVGLADWFVELSSLFFYFTTIYVVIRSVIDS
jgi:hypothetical protein